MAALPALQPALRASGSLRQWLARRCAPDGSTLMSYDVAIIGCGRVGLPLALAFADRGLRTLVGVENDPERLAAVRGAADAVRGARGGRGAAARRHRLVGIALPTRRRPTRSSSRSARRRSRTSRSTCATSARCSTTCCPCCARATCSCCARRSRPARPSSSRATSRSTAASRSASDVFVAHVPERIAAGRFFEEIATLPCIVGGVGEALGRAAARAVRAARRADRADDAGRRPSWRRSGPTSCATRCSRCPTS